ncbi:MAG: hypothetical protein ACFCUW_18485 [Kiloniellaceae bacterium]
MMTTLRSAAILLLTGLALGACQTAGRGEPPAATPAQVVAAPTTPAAPAPQTAALPPVNDDPAQLMGLDRGGVNALLGEPDLIRREAPAEVWQYVAEGCVFDVVLYARGQDYAVSYLEARDARAAVLAPRPCLNSLLRARQSAPVS